jgi:sugar (pentulose or hexulose) kinase
VAGFADGRPLFVRAANDKFTLANFMRTQLYAAVGVLKMGNDILFKDEKSTSTASRTRRLLHHKGVGQRVLAAALNSPISVMETAGEGGAWGIALLASYLVNKTEGQTLDQFLDEVVFAGNTGSEVKPTAEEVAGFEAYINQYKKGLAIEKAAVENKAAR